MAARKTVERFVLRVVDDLDEGYVLAVLLPWTRLPVPAGVLAPMRHPQDGLKYSQDCLTQLATKNPRTLLVPCTFDSEAEEESAKTLLPQLMERGNDDDVCVFLIYLFQHELENNDGAGINLVLERHNKMIQLHPDDVIVNPKPEPQALRQTIRLARLNWSLNLRRIQLFLEDEPEPVDPELLNQLQKNYRRLLWESIPRNLMRNFAAMDKTVTETGRAVGTYRFLRKLKAVEGTMVQAANEVDQRRGLFAIKVIDKARVYLFSQLEGIYREYGFLSNKIEHPNIAKCVQMLHTLNRVYLVFDYAGNYNVKTLLETRPNQQLKGLERNTVIKQLVTALAYCHGHDVFHRLVSLEHVVLMEVPGVEPFRCRLVDFQGAIESHDSTATSVIVCGKLPCVAPEVTLGNPYIPRLIDCWSAGVVFVEMAAGLSAMRTCVGYNPEEPVEAARAIQEFFRGADSHKRALTCLVDCEPDPDALNLAQLLVQPKPERRMEMRDVAQLEFLHRVSD